MTMPKRQKRALTILTQAKIGSFGFAHQLAKALPC
jgi:hypothetical protein